MRRIRRSLSTAAVLTLIVVAVAACSAKESVQVDRNSFTIKVNGQEVQADNVMLDDVPYVSLVDMAEHLGLEHEWDARGRIAQVWSKSEARTVTLEEKVDPFKPVIDLTVIGLRGDQVDAVGLQKGADWVPVPFQLGMNRLTIGEPDGIAPVLAMDQRFTLTIYAKNGSAYRIDFATSGLPDLTSTGQRRVVMVPAMPEKGFHWPYFLMLPSDAYKEANQGHKRYLIVETNNTGPDDPMSVMLAETRQDLERGFSSAIAEELWSPLLMPAFPRPHVAWHDGTQWRVLYTHALDRDTATLHLALAGVAPLSWTRLWLRCHAVSLALASSWARASNSIGGGVAKSP